MIIAMSNRLGVIPTIQFLQAEGAKLYEKENKSG